MQKVEGSSPFSRSHESPQMAGCPCVMERRGMGFVRCLAASLRIRYENRFLFARRRAAFATPGRAAKSRVPGAQRHEVAGGSVD
jgi:hypothetical protein